MNSAIYLSCKIKSDSMQKKPKLVSPLLKDKNELLASYHSLPREEQESIKEFLKIIRDDEEKRKKAEEEIKFIRKDKNNSPRLQELVRQFDYFNFELSEEERFLQREIIYKQASKILKNLDRLDYHETMIYVKKGIRTGVGNFLERTEKLCLYFVDINKFVYDSHNSVKTNITKELEKLSKSLEGIVDFAQDINARFNTYVCNNYQERFSHKFCRIH